MTVGTNLLQERVAVNRRDVELSECSYQCNPRSPPAWIRAPVSSGGRMFAFKLFACQTESLRKDHTEVRQH